MPRRSVVLLTLAAAIVGALLGFLVERASRRWAPRGEEDRPSAELAGDAAHTTPGVGAPMSAEEVAIFRPVREQSVLPERESLSSAAVASGTPHSGTPHSGTPHWEAGQGLPLSGLLSPVELPRERFPSGATLLGVAAAVGVVAIGLATWAFVVRDDTKTVTVSRPSAAVNQALAILASQNSERIPLAHAVGHIVLVVGQNGRALLVLDKLGPAPAGKSYQAWVIPPGRKVPVSAAVFTGSERLVPLQPVVVPRATVAVTLEQAGGATGPSHAPKLVAVRS